MFNTFLFNDALWNGIEAPPSTSNVSPTLFLSWGEDGMSDTTWDTPTTLNIVWDDGGDLSGTTWNPVNQG